MDINVGNSTGGADKKDFWPPDESGRPVRFIWHNFQAKPPVLDPFGRTDWVLWGEPQLWPGPDKPCAALYYACRVFYSAKMVTLGFEKPCCCYQACRMRFLR